MTTERPAFLSVAEAAKTLGVSRNTVYTLVRSGVIASVRIGRQIRIPAAVLEQLATVKSI